MEENTSPKEIKNSLFEKVANFLIKNSKYTALMGIGLIATGVVIGVNSHVTNSFQKLCLEAISHFCIIMGEIVTVAFAMHHFIEKQMHAHAIALISNASKKTIDGFNQNLAEWKERINLQSEIIQDNLIKGILHDSNILPYNIIACIKQANYKAHIFRFDLTIKYEFDKEEEESITFIQKINYKLKNVGGVKYQEQKFDMPLSLSPSAQATYEFIDAYYRMDDKKVKLNDENYTEKDRCRQLTQPINLSHGKIIEIYQAVKVCFSTKDNTIISDSFSSNLYTEGIEIRISRLPNEYTFSVYPTYDL